jgi:hypothetical protein
MIVINVLIVDLQDVELKWIILSVEENGLWVWWRIMTAK